MAGELTFGTFTIADPDNGDLYSRNVTSPRGELVTRDVVFAGTAGREIQVTGNQQTPETSLTISYGGNTRNVCMLVKASIAAFEEYLDDVAEFRQNSANLIKTLTDRDGSYTGMRWVSFTCTTPQRVDMSGGEKYIAYFEATFSRYTV